ncbi:hypothetical protein Nepgr_026075 [Nepenthes gracilis]|uniref:NLP1-9 GAF domain-containing protein n=1 Tax=Nepenthes gracilis TaxID=150966 RepID=A0AAD3T7L1_NEPGR|nr:hypothetical protein Nepgr_026075 [Nepenthes gracilis]
MPPSYSPSSNLSGPQIPINRPQSFDPSYLPSILQPFCLSLLLDRSKSYIENVELSLFLEEGSSEKRSGISVHSKGALESFEGSPIGGMAASSCANHNEGVCIFDMDASEVMQLSPITSQCSTSPVTLNRRHGENEQFRFSQPFGNINCLSTEEKLQESVEMDDFQGALPPNNKLLLKSVNLPASRLARKIVAHEPLCHDINYYMSSRRLFTFKYVLFSKCWDGQVLEVDEEIELMPNDNDFQRCWFRVLVLELLWKQMKIQHDEKEDQDGSYKEQTCRSTSAAAFYVVEAGMRSSHEAGAEYQVQSGQVVAGREIFSHDICFRGDIVHFCKTEYPLVHYACMFGLTSCFAICLRSKHTRHDDSVLEFCLPTSITDGSEQLELRDSILAVMKLQFQSLMVASGKVVEEERPCMEIVVVPKVENLDYNIESNKVSLPTNSILVLETFNRGLLASLEASSVTIMEDIDAVKDGGHVGGVGRQP